MTDEERLEELQTENRRLRAENERLRQLEREHEATVRSLAESEGRYRSVVEALDDGLVLHDHDGKIIAWNPSAERVLGLTADQLHGRTSLDPGWRCIHPDGRDFPGQEHPGRKTLETGESYTGVVMGVHKPDGELSWISVNSRPVEQPGGAGRYSVVASFCDITTRVNAETDRRHALEQKDILIRELFHRTRNNMQVIRSLLALRARRSDTTSVEKLVREVDERIRAMEMVHDELYASEDLTRILLDRYLERMLVLLTATHDLTDLGVDVQARLDPATVPVDTAVPCGLILCELVSNVARHAFPGAEGGVMNVSLTRGDDDELELMVSDDGVGLAQPPDPRTGDAVGLRLVEALVNNQLRGQLHVDGANGMRVQARFAHAAE